MQTGEDKEPSRWSALELLCINAWLAAMALYVLAGMKLASFHGDEAMQIYMSRDFDTAFIDHHPARLMVAPPYEIDQDPWLRIINGSINRYAIGLSRHMKRIDTRVLPPRPGWDWTLDYNFAVQAGYRPPDTLLTSARISSTIFLALSAWVMFAIGWQLGGRSMAYIVSALFVLNPIILLNGRRALMEGSMLCFGLLTIYLAILISRGWRGWLGWTLLALSAGLSLASKHTGVIFVAGAFGWIGLSELLAHDASTRISQSRWANILVKVPLCGIASVLIFVALSPALWNDPIARIHDLIDLRFDLISMQVSTCPQGSTTIPARMMGILTQPFMTPVAHFEVGFWARIDPITAEITRYRQSLLGGLHFGQFFGLLLTLLAGWGIICTLRQGRDWHAGLIAWFAITAVMLLANPLPWQRYFLPVIPVATIFAGVGLTHIFHFIRQQMRWSTLKWDGALASTP